MNYATVFFFIDLKVTILFFLYHFYKCTGVVVVCSHSFYILSIQLLKKIFQYLLLYIMREMLHSLEISFSQFIKGNPLDLQPCCHQVLLSKWGNCVFCFVSCYGTGLSL